MSGSASGLWATSSHALAAVGSRTLSILRSRPIYPDRVPNQPKSGLRLHSFRVSDEIWEAAKKRAEERDETLAEVLRAALARYLAN